MLEYRAHCQGVPPEVGSGVNQANREDGHTTLLLHKHFEAGLKVQGSEKSEENPGIMRLGQDGSIKVHIWGE